MLKIMVSVGTIKNLKQEISHLPYKPSLTQSIQLLKCFVLIKLKRTKLEELG